jgi:hypothetical protein
MTLRRHQADLAAVADGIAHGSGVNDIFAAVTPGSGKSALPGILADLHSRLGTWERTLAAYNAGESGERAGRGLEYAARVLCASV